jgi:hypothetical protein
MPRGIAPRRVLRLFLGVENGDVLIWPLRFFPRPSGTLGREGGQGRPLDGVAFMRRESVLISFGKFYTLMSNIESGRGTAVFNRSVSAQ